MLICENECYNYYSCLFFWLIQQKGNVTMFKKMMWDNNNKKTNTQEILPTGCIHRLLRDRFTYVIVESNKLWKIEKERKLAKTEEETYQDAYAKY